MFHRFLNRQFLLVSVCLVIGSVGIARSTSVEYINYNTQAILAGVEAIVDYHQFSINKTIFRNTIDKAKIGDNFYSPRSPLLSLFIAIPYVVFKQVTGKTFRSDYRSTAKFLYYGFGLFNFIIFNIYFLLIIRLWESNPKIQMLAFSAFCFGYIGLGYSSILNRHVLLTTLLLGGFYHCLKYLRWHRDKFHIVLASILFSLAMCFSMVCVPLVGLLALYLLYKKPKPFCYIGIPIATFVIAVNTYLIYLKTGQLLPLILLSKEGVFSYTGSYWANPEGLSSVDRLLHAKYREPKLIYLFHLTLGRSGIFTMTPLLILGSFGMIKACLKEPNASLHRTILAGLLITFLTLVFQTSNYGGVNFGFRFFVPFMAIVFLYLPMFFGETITKTKLWVFALALLISVYFNIECLYRGSFEQSSWFGFLWPLKM